MKKFLLLALSCLMIPVLSFSQDNSYVMVETIYLKPKIGSGEKFVKAVKDHNEKYHPEDSPYNAWMEAIQTGPHTGYFVWIMGPCTFTHLDSRPDGDHDVDWNKNVMPNVAEVTMGEYWKRISDLSYNAPDRGETPMSEMWFVDIKKGERYRFNGVLEKVKAVHEAKADRSINVWSNQFNANNGRDVVIVWDLKNWAEMDVQSTFRKDFEEMHGAGSWDALMDEWEDCVESMTQEIWSGVE